MMPAPPPLLERWRLAVVEAGRRNHHLFFEDEPVLLVEAGWTVGVAVKHWRWYVPGDVLLVGIWNGQAERFPTWCRTIKGPTVGRYYVQCGRFKRNDRIARDDRTPIILVEPPEGATAESPLAPAALSYVTEAHARVMCRMPGKRE